ncbi:hypothetical protein [Mammaliicoccus sciuri]|uniref:hypothetical protein n=1 Tax=Mammaliicoccus sciuri TaxID=1296 RepID=UPI0034DD76A6
MDENTAKIEFQLYNSKGTLQISEINIDAYAYFESANGSVSDVIDLEVLDGLNGIVGITLDKEFLQASTDTKVKGQVYIGVNNVDNNPKNNEVAVFREFTFEVADALINKISSFTKIEYIRMFDQLKARILQRVNDIEQAIANGADYVAEMKNVREQGINQINQTVSEGKAYIDSVIAQAQTNINDTATSAIGDVNTAKDNAVSNINNKVSVSVSEVQNTSSEAISHVDDKLNEFNQIIEQNGFVQPTDLDNKLNDLTWQKYKLTNEDGSVPLMRLDNNLTTLHELREGCYYTTQTPITNASSTAGFTTVTATESREVKHILFRPYNSSQQFIKRLSAAGWTDWERTGVPTDTGWIPFQLINGATGNTAFKNIGDNGFDCAYRTITNGSVTEKRVRINASNLAHLQQIAQLPVNFAKNSQFHYLRVPINCGYGLIGIFPNGNVFAYIESDKRELWNSSSNNFYFYGEISWKE